MNANFDPEVDSRMCVGPRTLLDEFPGIFYVNAGSDLEVASRFSVSPRTLLDEFPGISSCRSWTRLLTARCCAVLVMVQTAQLCAVLDKVVDLPVIVQVQGMVQTAQFCAVLDKVVDLPVIVQVQGMVQTVQISCSSWTRSLTCPLLCSLGYGPDSAVLRSSGQGC